ncbi:Uncharacterised protein [Chlamydia trachomatis]|nr:Uncharacterised protein [Chlamydia trachomatis]
MINFHQTVAIEVTVIINSWSISSISDDDQGFLVILIIHLIHLTYPSETGFVKTGHQDLFIWEILFNDFF